MECGVVWKHFLDRFAFRCVFVGCHALRSCFHATIVSFHLKNTFGCQARGSPIVGCEDLLVAFHLAHDGVQGPGFKCTKAVDGAKQKKVIFRKFTS